MNEEIVTTKKLSKQKLWLLRLKRKIFKHVWVLRIALLAVGISVVYLMFLLFSLIIRKTQAPVYFGFAYDFVFVKDEKIKFSKDRTNVLILGKGGRNHEAGDLTDTIILVSIPHKGSGITMISLSRDIWIPELRAKLNSTYYWGNQKKEGGGLVLVKSVVEQIVGEPVHYALLLDFDGFVQVVDVMEGVQVDVERSFTDEKYPIPGREDDECDGDIEFGCRYETVEFSKGMQLMNGETALKFVRSRNAGGDEGTDFARSQRQQKVINATKEKMISSETIFSLNKLVSIKSVLSDYTETDVDSAAAAILARRIFYSRDDVNSHLLPEEFIENPPKSQKYDNLYVFIPTAGEWSEVHGWVECVLEGVGNCVNK